MWFGMIFLRNIIHYMTNKFKYIIRVDRLRIVCYNYKNYIIEVTMYHESITIRRHSMYVS